MMAESRRRGADFWWPMALSVAALAANLTSIGRPAIWRDETATIEVAHRSPIAILRLLRHDDAPLGPYYLFMHAWLRVADSAFWVRLPSAVGGAAAVGFVYLLGSRLAGRTVGVVSGVVLAALPFSTRYAQEARPYALVMCAATAATWLLVVAVGERRQVLWIGYGATLAAAVALHEVAALLVVAHLATLAVTNGRQYRRYLPWLVSLLPAAAAGAALSLLAVGDSSDRSWIPKPGVETPYHLAVDFAGSRPALALLIVVSLAAAVVARPRSRQTGTSADLGFTRPAVGVLAVAVPWLLLPGVSLILASRVTPLFLPRYVLFCLPALALIAATAVVQVIRALSDPGLRRLVSVVVAVALVAVVAQPQRALRRLDAHGDDPKAEAAQLIAVSQAGDGIVYQPRDLAHSLLAFATASQLPVDAVLIRSAVASATLNGVEVAPAAVPAAVLRFPRVWLLDVPGFDSWTPAATAVRTTLASRYRQVSIDRIHGSVLVLFDRDGP